MRISALTSSLPVPLTEAVSQIARLGFDEVDVPPTVVEPAAWQTLTDSGLSVACVALERQQPAGLDLAASDPTVRQRTREYYQRGLDATAQVGAPVAYLTPPADDDDLRRRWAEQLGALGDHARARSLRLCVEHFPGRSLPTVAATLEFLDRLAHPGLALLLDVGHCLISREEPDEAVRAAGSRLGYVHFDDNDGQGDLHWPLGTGCLTESQIRQTLTALDQTGYSGAVCLELNSELDSPVENLRAGREMLVQLGVER